VPRSSSAAGGATRTRSSRSSSSPPCAFASQLGAAVGCLVVAGIAIGGVVTGDTPLAGDATTTAQIFQALFGFAAVSLLVLGVILSEREEANESLAEAQELAHIGSWEWEIAADRVTWSRELYRIFGLHPRAGLLTFARYLERIHPGDRDRVRTEVERALTAQRPFEFLHRIVLDDGTSACCRHAAESSSMPGAPRSAWRRGGRSGQGRADRGQPRHERAQAHTAGHRTRRLGAR